ncbi:hypothetical protein [Photobacterium marinum]|uniref:hypothetical protein n=1 Tax=Photobacterium marinum TaxID=1056511 RepID=UPI0005641B33|nr:hypothetical protein [Photobacterium marinum]
MKNIFEFIEQLESGKHHFNIWVYSNKGHYCQFDIPTNKPRTSPLKEAVENHLQVLVEIHNDEIDNAFLLLPEVHMVLPVAFHDEQILLSTRPLAV